MAGLRANLSFLFVPPPPVLAKSFAHKTFPSKYIYFYSAWENLVKNYFRVSVRAVAIIPDFPHRSKRKEYGVRLDF
jgi:hypothetical protein